MSPEQPPSPDFLFHSGSRSEGRPVASAAVDGLTVPAADPDAEGEETA